MNFYNILLTYNQSGRNQINNYVCDPIDILKQTHVPSSLSISKMHNLFQTMITKSKFVELVKYPLPAYYFTLIVKSEYGIFNDFIIDFSLFGNNIEQAKSFVNKFIDDIKFKWGKYYEQPFIYCYKRTL